jgi:hypothetical protein
MRVRYETVVKDVVGGWRRGGGAEVVRGTFEVICLQDAGAGQRYLGDNCLVVRPSDGQKIYH